MSTKAYMPEKYEQPELSIPHQIDLLKKRGLLINDEFFAAKKLDHIGYYHLSEYFNTFQNKETKVFYENVSFEKIINLYDLDREIRLYCFDAIERIELSLKSFLTNVLSVEFGKFWYLKKELFQEGFSHEVEINRLQKPINRLRNKKENSVSDFYEKYPDEKHLPSWILMEISTFGAALKLFQNLERGHRQKISKKYGFDEKIIESWFVLLLDVRNICAHHGRLWNKNLKGIVIPRKKPEFSTKGKLWNAFLIFSYFFSVISPDSNLIKNIIKTVENSGVNPSEMGFGENWKAVLLRPLSKKN